MSRNRLSGFVRPAKRQGKVVRGLWELWVSLPPEPAQGRDGLPLLDKRGRPKMRYPKTMKCVPAQGKKAAERLLEARIAELETHQSIDVEKLTLASFLDRWLEATYGEMRVATRNSSASIRRLHVDPALGGVLALELTRTQLAAYYSAKMRGNGARPLAETTVAHHHSMIKAAYNWAIDEELLTANPAQRLKNPPALRPKVRPVWSMEEIARVVVRARGLQVHAAGVLAGFSGLRVGEVAGLRWSDLDLDQSFVHVQRTIEEDEDKTLIEYPPKNGKARVVPLPPVACDELRSILKAQKEYRLAHGKDWNAAGLVLPKRDGSPMAPSSLKSMWWTWVARQKVQPHLPMHGLRDSFGTWVYETCGVKQAQEWLGHGDPATTLRHYVRLTTAARAKAVAGLDEATRAALEAAEIRAAEDAPPVVDSVVELAARRR
jgi:integrase